MSTYFFDTSALAKLYMEERGSAAALALADSSQGQLALSSLGVVELRAAIRGRQREGALAAATADLMLQHFARALEKHWLRQPLGEAAFELATVFIDRHALRAPDALQLAACMAVSQMQSVQFVCSDLRLLAAARAEGIPCWDPAGAVE